MPSFSDIIRDHNQLKSTITQIEQMKNRIKANERQMFPPAEFSLRTAPEAVGMSDFGMGAAAGEAVQGLDIAVGLTALLQSITTGFLSPYQVKQMWSILSGKMSGLGVTATQYKQDLGNFLSQTETKSKFTASEIGTLKAIIEILIKDLQPTPANPQIIQFY